MMACEVDMFQEMQILLKWIALINKICVFNHNSLLSLFFSKINFLLSKEMPIGVTECCPGNQGHHINIKSVLFRIGFEEDTNFQRKHWPQHII